MLLVAKPRQSDLRKILSGLLQGSLSREEVVSWQRAVFEQFGWNINIDDKQGYWYFYALGFVDLEFPDGPFLRECDFEEYLNDINGVHGVEVAPGVRHLRTFETTPNQLRWPLTVIEDAGDIMAGLPSTRGTFERRLDLVEHCHLAFEGNQYLLLKQFDELTGQVLLLGSSRNPEQSQSLLRVLGVG